MNLLIESKTRGSLLNEIILALTFSQESYPLQRQKCEVTLDIISDLELSKRSLSEKLNVGF